MYRPLPENAHHVNGIKVSPWTQLPDSEWCAMRYIEGTDPEDVANRVAFIEKTPRVRYLPPTEESEDWRNWHGAWKGDDGHCPAARGWCDTHLLALGYIVPDPMPFEDSMLD